MSASTVRLSQYLYLSTMMKTRARTSRISQDFTEKWETSFGHSSVVNVAVQISLFFSFMGEPTHVDMQSETTNSNRFNFSVEDQIFKQNF